MARAWRDCREGDAPPRRTEEEEEEEEEEGDRWDPLRKRRGNDLLFRETDRQTERMWERPLS